MEEFDELLAEAKKRGMFILMDLVVNHCSDKHEWFQKALEDPEGDMRNIFILYRERMEKSRVIIVSYFGGSAWERCRGRRNIIFIMFAKEQPDLNWENPKLRDEIYKMMNWWLDKGLAGFRIDAIINIKKRSEFPVV